MGAYESIEKYAEFTGMPLEQAKVRYEHFMEIKKQMHESKKCPKCHEYTLAIEGGEWESGVSDWIYCENDKIQTRDEEGDAFYAECDFTDNVKKEYLFAFEIDFDVVLYFACQIKEEGLESVEQMIGRTWKEFLDKENSEIISKLEDEKSVLEVI